MNWKRVEKWGIVGTTAGLAAAAGSLLTARGMSGFFADSEIWSVTLAKHFSEQWVHPWVYSRIAFYLPLAISEAIPTEATQILLAARGLMVGNALAIAALTFLISARLTRSAWAGSVAAMLLLTHPTFFNHAYRIRADLIATTLILFPLWLSLNRPALHTKQKAALLLPLLATVKSAFIAAPFVLYYRPCLPKRLSPLQLGIILVVAAAAIATTYVETIRYALEAFKGSESTPSYFSLARFSYVFQAISSGVPLSALVVLRAVTLGLRFRRNAFPEPESRECQLRVVKIMVALSILVAANPEKMPYFIASALPIYAIFAAGAETDIRALLGPARATSGIRRALTIALTAFLAFPFAIVLRDYAEKRAANSNSEQFAAIRALAETLESNGNPPYFDGVGIVPTHYPEWGMIGPNQPELNASAMEQLRARKPAFIFYGARLFFLGPGLMDFLNENYVHGGMGVYARACPSGEPVQCPGLNPRRFLVEIRGEDWIAVYETGLEGLQEQIRRTLAEKGAAAPKSVRYSAFVPKISGIEKSLAHLFRFDGET